MHGSALLRSSLSNNKRSDGNKWIVSTLKLHNAASPAYHAQPRSAWLNDEPARCLGGAEATRPAMMKAFVSAAPSTSALRARKPNRRACLMLALRVVLPRAMWTRQPVGSLQITLGIVPCIRKATEASSMWCLSALALTYEGLPLLSLSRNDGTVPRTMW